MTLFFKIINRILAVIVGAITGSIFAYKAADGIYEETTIEEPKDFLEIEYEPEEDEEEDEGRGPKTVSMFILEDPDSPKFIRMIVPSRVVNMPERKYIANILKAVTELVESEEDDEHEDSIED